MIVFYMLCIAISLVIIIDLSGFVDNLKSFIKWVVTKGKMSGNNYRLYVIDCSLCASFWCNIILLLVMGKFTIGYICLALIIALFTDVIKDTILLVKDVFLSIINKINSKL